MRLQNRSEQQFVETLVEGTRLLLANSEITTPQKIATLKKAIAGHAQQAIWLRAQRNALADVDRMTRIDRLIKLREEAVAYLKATADWLARRGRTDTPPEERPKMFAVPTWHADQLSA